MSIGRKHTHGAFVVMPRFVVRVCKTELVLLSADLTVTARSAQSARAKIRRSLAHGDEIDDRLWFESDSADTEEPIVITDVWRDRTR